MTSVLVVNTGSSSLKLRLLGPGGEIRASLDIDHWDGSADHGELRRFLGTVASADVAGADAIGHRIVHGGSRFSASVLIDDEVLKVIAGLASLAPLHQPRAIAGIKAVRAALPCIPAVACFDTAFHAGLPDAAATYALPRSWRQRFGLRRYGFHGLSHAYASRRATQLLGAQCPARSRLVTCHLGAGSSLAAVRDGRSVDTTMGFTPLEGLVMASRPGSVDPGLVVWLQQHGDLSVDDIALGLEKSSGLAGLANLGNGSGDMRDVRRAADAGEPDARLAIEVHAHRLRREIAAMAAAMNGLDALVFTGGIGEHQPAVRAEAAAGLDFLGVKIDPALNDRTTADGEITAPDAAVRTLVVTAREDIEIARQVRELVNGTF
ncbi:MAG TPA: acetate/propionate family kinase [Streptosporangiaceae bacterium]|nr:acetate/propionate family kinase [Streptosporangiaceae bacterium]